MTTAKKTHPTHLDPNQTTAEFLRRPARSQSLLLERGFRLLGLFCTVLALMVLAGLLFSIISQGVGQLSIAFLTNSDSRFPESAGIYPALIGTLYVIGLTIAIALPLGVAAAIYLEEYGGQHWFSRAVEVNIANLAAVPSIIYGLFGLHIFARTLALDRSVLTAGLTLALLVVPIIIVAARESIRAVPSGLRQAAYALGATRWQTVWHHVLPLAWPGILTGSILAVARAIGETAALITLGALTFVTFLPQDLLDAFTTLTVVIFNWTTRPQEEFQALASAASLVLLVILLVVNALAILLRQWLRKRR